MAELGRVIKGLECCVTRPNEYGDCDATKNDCPYRGVDCHVELMRDALTILRAQEPVKPNKKIIGCGKRYYCGVCNVSIEPNHKFCRMCGRAVKWDDR